MAALSRKRIKAAFDESGIQIWSRQPLLQFIQKHCEHWSQDDASPDSFPLPAVATVTQVLNLLVKQTQLKSVSLPFPYRSVTRFVWGEVSTYSLIQAVDAQGYFTHYTAMQLHNLTDQIPKAIYFNVEQPATGGGGSLTQGGIDRAFKGKCRVTNNVIKFRDVTIHKVNGQNTGRLGVESMQMADGSTTQVTNLERTLIDIAVRPIYSGGVAEVSDAYKAAADKVSGNRLTTYLKSLNYTYPYHQVIGYYMDRAGNYSESQIKRIQAIPREHDFYLTYQIKNPAYNEKWRLFVPNGF